MGEAGAAFLLSAARVIEASPEPAIGAPCERANLSFNSRHEFARDVPKQTGNTEIVALDYLGEVKTLAERTRKLYADPSVAQDLMAPYQGGPAVHFGHMYLPSGGYSQSAGPSEYDDKKANPDEIAELERARGVSHMVVMKGPADRKGPRLSAYLFEFPSAKLVCGFTVEGVADADIEDKDYSAANAVTRTTSRFTTDDVLKSARKNTALAMAYELKQRFQLDPDKKAPAKPPAPRVPDNDTLKAAKALWAKMVTGLSAEVPACTGAPPAGTVSTYTLHLHRLAELPEPPATDANVVFGDGSNMDEAFRAYGNGYSSPESRTEHARRLLSAPTVIRHVDRYQIAKADDTKWEPGVIEGRYIQFDTTGKPVCSRPFSYRNPPDLRIHLSHGKITQLGLEQASLKDLKRQLSILVRD
jgi:hypothetical protein